MKVWPVASSCGNSCQHPRTDGKPLIDSEHGAGQAGECLPGAGHTRQEILCELFARVLGVIRCGADSDFFDLGGRSVEAMVLAGRISAAFGQMADTRN